jgi:DNA-directed RNA polymerase subunit RPC12/RpoP
LLPGFNDLKTSYPQLAKEAVGWDPSRYGSGSKNRMAWKCKKGHIFNSIISDRALKGSDCPYCSGNKVLKGFNDLKTTHPIIASQAVNWDPSEYSFGSHKTKDWKCKLGHIYKTTINSRTGKDDTAGCPYCHGTKVLIGFNDLATTHPDISREAFKWSPKNYSAGSVTKLWWLCAEGHKWKAMPNSRTSNGTGCPTCANKVILTGFNDLNTLHPNIAVQANPDKIRPFLDLGCWLQITAGSLLGQFGRSAKKTSGCFCFSSTIKSGKSSRACRPTPKNMGTTVIRRTP